MPELNKLSMDTNTSPTPQVKTSTPAGVSVSPVTSTTTKPTTSSSNNMSSTVRLLLFVIPILLGVLTGFAVNKYAGSPASGTDKSAANIDSNTVKEGDIIGAADKSTYKDEVEGYLEKGGLDGEGSHHLVRAGGVSQTVYLTSSVVDLDALVGSQVHVWGETFNAQKAGWLMDVGRVQVVKLNAEKPQ